MTSVYRLSSSKFPADSGVGAALYGGRWNRVGTEAIYAATSASLALLEILVHFDVLPQDFALTEVFLPQDISVKWLEYSDLPVGWDSETVTVATQDIGERWIRERAYAALSVPSSIVPAERNLVINPAHPAFPYIQFGDSVPFRFDSRLK